MRIADATAPAQPPAATAGTIPRSHAIPLADFEFQKGLLHWLLVAAGSLNGMGFNP